MSYTPTTWVDEALSGPVRYNIKDNGGTPIDSNVQIELATPVAVAGTPVTAAAMNNIEDELVALEAATTGGVTATSTTTLTNKRITRRVVAITNNANPTYNTDNGDVFTMLALNTNIASMTANMSGTPTPWQRIEFVFKDAGAPQTIGWGTIVNGGVAVPGTTVAGKYLRVICEYTGTAWQCIGIAQEA